MIRAIAAMMAVQAATVVLPERLEAPTPPGFVTGYDAHNTQIAITERIPRGETVEQWSRMITVQRFTGIARVGGHGFLDRLANGVKRSCQGASTTPIVDSVADGRAVASMRADCPLNSATGKAEVFFVTVFTGAADIHSVQYAFRSVPTAKDAAVAEAYLDSIALCPGSAKACAAS